MREWLGILICTTVLGACGGALITPKGPPPPRPVLVGDVSLLKFADHFHKDCVKNLTPEKCQLPHKIAIGYFPRAQYPDRRGYAEIWGRGKEIAWVDVRIADYLKASLWKDGLLVTVYHELFHAWFNLDHDDTSLGIMNSVAYFDDDVVIAADFQYYVAKEFARVEHK